MKSLRELFGRLKDKRQDPYYAQADVLTVVCLGMLRRRNSM